MNFKIDFLTGLQNAVIYYMSKNVLRKKNTIKEIPAKCNSVIDAVRFRVILEASTETVTSRLPHLEKQSP